MDFRQTLEYPLPILSVSKAELVIEAKGEHSEMILIKNTGGGTLEGKIISPTKSLTFVPDQWEGNRQEVTCKFLPDPVEGWKPGDVRNFSVLILSNGTGSSGSSGSSGSTRGGFFLAVTVRIAKMAIQRPEGVTITNLQDFYDYGREYPKEAEDLFGDSTFHMLLLAMEFPYTDAYVLLKKDTNRPRALDNFFILAGLKKRTVLIAPEPQKEHRVINNAMIHGDFTVQKSDKGYIEADISSEGGAAWLKLESDTLTIDDFDSDNTATVKYTIDPLLIKGSYARDRAIIKSFDDIAVELVFKRPGPFRAWLPREGFSYQDEGSVMIENQTGEPLKIELSCKENYVRFYQQEYEVEDSMSIPFIIKLSPLQSAQMLFRKVPSLFAEIEVRALYKETFITKSLPLTAGEW